MSSEFPPVSALCVTYGRPHVLEESIYSFLQQDYQGPKELVILNDFAEQTLRFDHPEVRIINRQERYPSLGDKRNASVELASHDLLFVWDDDDIFLPHRLRYSVEQMRGGLSFFKQGGHALILNDGKVTEILHSIFHSASCYTRALFKQVGGYQPLGRGEDMYFEQALHQILGDRFPQGIADPNEYFYLYRWAGTNSYHASWYEDKPEQSGNQQVADFVRQQVASAAIPVGDVTLNPLWRADYAALSKAFLQTYQTAASSTPA